MTLNPRANPTANPTDTRSDLQGPVAPDPDAVGRVAVIGAGTIGASWAALFLSRGMSVAISDPNPAAEVAG
ncbi:3-hydroxyacyl-CoA dehydrogenase NAD-binding domain-containing protein, partial [Azospirillum sp. TSH20]|uniref:3-hydroxyacyl-CoA dehydrogenase NAD-binding domain-containing protein n=1 Tax=Azospirillum sp. TSH20 TaxID=652754 RepID=UPI001FFEC4E5